MLMNTHVSGQGAVSFYCYGASWQQLNASFKLCAEE